MGGGFDLTITPGNSAFAVDIWSTDNSIGIAPIPYIPSQIDSVISGWGFLNKDSGNIVARDSFGRLPEHASRELGSINRFFVSGGIETSFSLRIPGFNQWGRYQIFLLYDRCGVQ